MPERLACSDMFEMEWARCHLGMARRPLTNEKVGCGA